MKKVLQNQSLVELLRNAVEAWRRSAPGQMSRETVAIHVTDAHERIGADAATGITFESTSKDAYTRAKSAAQKLYRWFGGDDEQEAKLPANMVPSILAALPIEQRVAVLNQIFCSLDVEVRAVDQAPAIGFDPLKHLKNIAKESAEGKLALIQVGAEASEEQLLQVRVELTEAAEAYQAAADDVTAEIHARRALARASA